MPAPMYDMVAHEKPLSFEYPDESMKVWETLWGEDFISPGGVEETRYIVRNEDLSDKTILDVGSGLGGPSFLFAKECNAKKVVGIDLQEKVIPLANAKAKERGLSDKVEFVHVSSLRWPFGDETFDVIFSKDSLLHTADKETVYAEMTRVLKPGGKVIYADWFGCDLPPTPEMTRWMEASKLTMVLKSLGFTADLFIRLGFTDIRLEDRCEWFRKIFMEKMHYLDSDVGKAMKEEYGEARLEEEENVWFASCPVLAEQGQLRLGNLYATKPSKK